MNKKIIFCLGVLIVSSILIFFSCKKQTNSKKLNGIYIVPLSGASTSENKTLLYSTTPYKFALAAAISSAIGTDVDLNIAVDNSLVSTFNKAQKTTYAVMPEGSYSLEATSLKINKDQIASNQTNLVVKSNLLTNDVSYLLPVKVSSVSSNEITLNSAIATKYYIIRTPTPIIGNLSDGKNSYWKNPDESYNPFRGNDGNTDGEWGNASVCESGAGLEQYWEVDLGGVSPRIDDVKIWNRTDCCDDRTAKFYLFISDVPFTGKTVAASLAQPGVYNYYNDGKAGLPTVVLPKVSGRYIRLQNTTSASLTLAELTATGVKP
ncbi:BT_3987 domain-containing protein [Pedobacter nyackensis]|uniref:BT_3987 domain-containing protein n=1 Tax=Pedobacter nyackensis TaxID=475255 RepID=UPI00293185C9|nr:DUF1735 domain-containing protein [Pedobacter nyackensis]